MTRETDAIDLELRRVLRSLRDGPPAPKAVQTRLSDALQLAATRGPDGLRPTSPLPGRVGRLRRLASTMGPGWMVGGGAAVVVLGTWLAFRPGTAGAPLATSAAFTGDRHASPSAPAASATGAPSLQEPPLHPGALGSALVAEPRPERHPPRDGSLAAERRLLDAARAALVGDDASTGMSKLTQHARLYLHGALAEEREALMVDALVAKGNYQEARRRANAFRVRYPRSLFAPSVAAALQSIP